MKIPINFPLKRKIQNPWGRPQGIAVFSTGLTMKLKLLIVLTLIICKAPVYYSDSLSVRCGTIKWCHCLLGLPQKLSEVMHSCNWTVVNVISPFLAWLKTFLEFFACTQRYIVMFFSRVRIHYILGTQQLLSSNTPITLLCHRENNQTYAGAGITAFVVPFCSLCYP